MRLQSSYTRSDIAAPKRVAVSVENLPWESANALQLATLFS